MRQVSLINGQSSGGQFNLHKNKHVSLFNVYKGSLHNCISLDLMQIQIDESY